MNIVPIKVELIDSCGSDLSVVNAARVSMDKESEWECFSPDGTYPLMPGDPMDMRLSDKDVKLIKYLADHKHFSPFNHAFLSFRVKAPIFVSRQLVKHKFLPWNEISRRYVDSEPEFYIPSHNEWRARGDNVKQGSAEWFVKSVNLYPEQAVEKCLMEYGQMLDQGVCPEMARMILPQNTMTEWIWSGTLGAWLDMLVLRLDPHTQKETRDVAELIAKGVKQLFPESFKARVG